MADLSDMNLDKFRLWSVTALKTFLSLRKKSIDGSDGELVARAFIAWEEKVPVDLTAEHEERKLLSEYKMKLTVANQVLPDPFSLQSGWTPEASGLPLWPSVYITDISSYLNDNTPQELVHKVVNEYKVGKAYRYYACDWVQEVMYHPVRDNSPLCLLKAKVTPSMTLSANAYDVWVAVKKRSESSAGGQILSAYCTCTAGMLGTCNHIAGLLFRVEAAVVSGQTAKTCTEVLCQWNIPSAQKAPRKPVTADSLTWTKKHFSKRGDGSATSARSQHSKAKTGFSPLASAQVEEVKDKRAILKKLSAIAARCAPDARFHKLLTKAPPVPPQPCPPTLSAMADECIKTDGNTAEVQQQFHQSLHFTQEQYSNLKSATTQQGNKEWLEQRKGRITASNFGRVTTRMKTLDTDQTADPSSLLGHVMGYGETFTSDSLRHGISCEPHAKMVYNRDMKRRHKKFKSCDSGISVLPEKPYISASADLEIGCECCGNGLCEIKCPYSIKDVKPTVDNVPYLEERDGQLQLKTSHAYYAQVQGQMGILNRDFCDLYVFTFHGSVCVRVPFDKGMWVSMLIRLDRFWTKYVLPELFGKDLKSALSAKETTPTPTTSSSITSQASLSIPVVFMVKPSKKINSKKAARPAKRRRVATKPVCLCCVCGLVCVDDPDSVDAESIECSSCSMWCHIPCGRVDTLPSDNEDWNCPKCV